VDIVPQGKHGTYRHFDIDTRYLGVTLGMTRPFPECLALRRFRKTAFGDHESTSVTN
jgi:hypothetical protein